MVSVVGISEVAGGMRSPERRQVSRLLSSLRTFAITERPRRFAGADPLGIVRGRALGRLTVERADGGGVYDSPLAEGFSQDEGFSCISKENPSRSRRHPRDVAVARPGLFRRASGLAGALASAPPRDSTPIGRPQTGQLCREIEANRWDVGTERQASVTREVQLPNFA